MDDEVVEHEPNANVIDFAFHNDDLQGESVVDVCEPQECETGSQNDGSRIAQTYRRYSEEPLPPINEINPCFCICDEYIFSPGFTNGVLSFCSCRVCVGFLCMLPCYATRARRTVMGRGLTMADCFCPCVPLFQTRQKLREARGYTPHVVSDAITATMCCPCACYQTAAEAGVVTDYHVADCDCFCDSNSINCCVTCCKDVCYCPCDGHWPNSLETNTPTCVCPGGYQCAACCCNDAGQCALAHRDKVCACYSPHLGGTLHNCSCDMDICREANRGCHVTCDCCKNSCNTCDFCTAIDCSWCSLNDGARSVGEKCDDCLACRDCSVVMECLQGACGSICDVICNSLGDLCTACCERACKDISCAACNNCGGCDCKCIC